jgi:hypothetical protein
MVTIFVLKKPHVFVFVRFNFILSFQVMFTKKTGTAWTLYTHDCSHMWRFSRKLSVTTAIDRDPWNPENCLQTFQQKSFFLDFTKYSDFRCLKTKCLMTETSASDALTYFFAIILEFSSTSYSVACSFYPGFFEVFKYSRMKMMWWT